MRRRYSRTGYLDLIDELRGTVPDLAISTDMIIGFPGETDEDFALTLDLVRRAQYRAIYSFKYSPRPNTLAVRRMRDDVPEAEKTSRILALQQLQRDIQIAWHESVVGRTFEVLVDSRSRRRDWELAGRTTGNSVVNFPGAPDWLGRLVPVTITGAAPNSLRGMAAEPASQKESTHVD
jgi:tRNA-2-methylthio-N6-dimethylallyladenosine synthase